MLKTKVLASTLMAKISMVTIITAKAKSKGFDCPNLLANQSENHINFVYFHYGRSISNIIRFGADKFHF